MAEKIASKYNWTFHFKLVKGYNNATGIKIKNISKSIFLGGFPYPLSLSSFLLKRIFMTSNKTLSTSPKIKIQLQK